MGDFKEEEVEEEEMVAGRGRRMGVKNACPPPPFPPSEMDHSLSPFILFYLAPFFPLHPRSRCCLSL